MSHLNVPERPTPVQATLPVSRNDAVISRSALRSEWTGFELEANLAERCIWNLASHPTSEETIELYNRDDSAVYKVMRYEKPKMLAKGWCPHHLEHLSKTYDNETFLYLTKLDRSPLRRIDHTLCTDKPACIAYNTDLSTYKPRHITNDCTCPIISTPYEELIKTIQKGRIPLVSIEGGQQHMGDLLTIQIHGRKRKARYVAISHVWADGLGNPKDNGLPACQIKMLEEHIKALRQDFGGLTAPGDPVLFWMDTLCIPVKPPD